MKDDEGGGGGSSPWFWPLIFGILVIIYIFFGGAADYALENNLPQPEEDQAIISSVGTHPSGSADRVFIHSVFNAIATTSQTEYITLRAAAQNARPLSLQGFKMKTSIGGVFPLPYGISTYLPGTTERAQPIEILPGEFVMVHTGRSPLGVSFKDNICLHLLRPQFIYPTPDIPAYLRYQGTDYIECVQTMKGSPEFHRPLWHVYLGASEEIWQNDQDIIRLIDRAGSSVDAIRF